MINEFSRIFKKTLDCHGIPIRASAAVEDRALEIASNKITMMLEKIPAVRRVLIAQGAEFHIIGRTEQTSDLPENRCFKDERYIDAQGNATSLDDCARGLGGLHSSYCEENLLDLPEDRYAGGQDICIHEFAHTIMDYKLTALQRQQIVDRYHAALDEGLWRDAYAATNEQEYWAELSMWFFGSRGYRSNTPPAGTKALRNYDPAGWLLLAELYGRPNGIQ